MRLHLNLRYLVAMLALAALMVGILGAVLLVLHARSSRLVEREAAAFYEAVGPELPTAGISGHLEALRNQLLESEHRGRRIILVSLAGVAVVLVALATTCAAIVDRLVDRPIAHLAALTDSIGPGRPAPALPTRRADEVGDLARVFTRLAQDLERITVSHDKFDLIVANMRDGLAVTDRDGRITDANRAFLRLARRTQDDVLGRAIRGFLADHPGSPARSLDSFETGFRVDEGEPVPILLSSSPITGADGHPQGTVYVVHDITERKRAEDRVRHLAHHDVLTGLPNRALLADRLHQAMARARREGLELALLLLDLDHFKAVNDKLGHTAGDEVLKQAAARIADIIRTSDTVARFGGDEFVVVQAVHDVPADVEVVCQRLVASLDPPLDVAGCEVRLGASVGIAIFPQDGTDLDGLLRAADRALYAAKQAGRSTWRYANWSPSSASGAGPS